MATRWVSRWRYEISPHPVLPGVWRKKEGGFVVRGRVTDPTGRKRELLAPVEAATPDEARAYLLRQLEAIRHPASSTPSTVTRFSAYAASVMERRVRDGSIRSAMTRQKWDTILGHLIQAFGPVDLRELRRTEVVAWRDAVAEIITAGKLAPSTANGWLATLRVIVGEFVHEHELDRNPVTGVKDFDTSTHTPYTDEEPNSLTVEEVRRFLAAMCKLFPQHYAMTALGFATGLRPSTLRPLRRHGPHADMLWDDLVLLIRRSQTVGDEVMNKPKTGKRQRVALPPELVHVLRWHVDRIPAGKMLESDLLFPSDLGGFRSRSVLDKPFKAVAKAIALTKRITPRGMRRTFQDLARAAQVKDIVTRSISGHATEEMQDHYSTVDGDEQRGALAKVVSLAGFRDALAGAPEGVKEGVKSRSA